MTMTIIERLDAKRAAGGYRPRRRRGVMRQFSALAGLALLAACATTAPQDGADTGLCRAEAAKALIGQSAPDDATILRRTGSATVQRLAPGDMMTRDFRAERVRVQIDDTGRVTTAFCG